MIKKTGTNLESLQDLCFSYFLKVSKIKVASADKMMVNARPCSIKNKRNKIIPEGLGALDQEATWSYSRADGWVYGHGWLFAVMGVTIQIAQLAAFCLNRSTWAIQQAVLGL